MIVYLLLLCLVVWSSLALEQLGLKCKSLIGGAWGL